MTIQVVFLVLALVCFIIGATGYVARIGWVSLGLAFWVLSLLVNGGGAHVLR